MAKSNGGSMKEWASRRHRNPARPASPPAAPVTATPMPYYGAYQPPPGYALVPMVPAPAPPSPAAPAMQPPPLMPGRAQGEMGRLIAFPPPTRTCELVKADAVDPYAELISGVPDLVPPTGYDAMAGNPSPESLHALQEARSGGDTNTLRDSKTGAVLGTVSGGGLALAFDAPVAVQGNRPGAPAPRLGEGALPPAPSWLAPPPGPESA